LRVFSRGKCFNAGVSVIIFSWWGRVSVDILAVLSARISDEDCPFLDRVALLPVHDAHVYRVFVVQTPADVVSFHDEEAHCDRESRIEKIFF
jgi:hypothetical protein